MSERRSAGGDTLEPLDFLGTLWALEHALQAASKRMYQRLGITGTQRFVIRMLGRLPGIGAGELAVLLHDHPSTLTGVLARLVDQGLITRGVHPDDRRKAVLRLTDAGREVDLLREGTIEAAVSRAMASVSADQLAATREVLLTVVAELERVQGTTPP